MNSSRVAVIGSNSFAGSVFVAHALELGLEVLGISRSAEPHSAFRGYEEQVARQPGSFRFVQADIGKQAVAVYAALQAFAPAYVVDFAAQSMVAESWLYPEDWYRTNIVAKVGLHNFLRRQSWLSKYLRISTPEVYGSRDVPIDEHQAYNPSTPYAVSQAAADMSLRTFHQNYGFPVVTGRFANFYGPHQQLYRIVPRTIMMAHRHERLGLHGGGHSRRAFIHAMDAARGIAAMMEMGRPGEIYHFSPDSFITIRALVERLAGLLGMSFEALAEDVADRPGKDAAYLMDSGKARRELGWQERISLDEGLDQTIHWIEQRWDELRELPIDYQHRP